jgi:D-glycero-alpha-D-manno-heptose-7-phosphate kinase
MCSRRHCVRRTGVAVITTRTPLRITLGGGGSDLVAGHGICLAATIDKYVTVTVSENWDDDYLLHYSQTERVKSVDDIQHRIIRDVFRKLDIPPGIQVSSHADVPAGTGLGNSGAFTVGLIKALRPELSPLALAKLACELDIGQQDQWSAVFGGMNVYGFGGGSVRPVETSLGDCLALYYTGMKHDAATVLAGPPKTNELAIQQINDMVRAFEVNSAVNVGWQLTRQWREKLEAAPTAEHQQIDVWIRYGSRIGANGGKLVGAGDGGFLLFSAWDHLRLEAAMKELGLRRLPFKLTHEGSRCV